MSRPLRPRLAAALLLAAASAGTSSGCGGTAAPPVVELDPAEAVPPRLVPPREAVETARGIELTGSELGTMWTFEDAPLDRWEEAYGFRPSSGWLEHARLSSLRYGDACSASFVSPHGLAMTNHHCARACVDAVDRPGEDLLHDGFLARHTSEERRCPGLHLDHLVEITDVTERLTADDDDLTPVERSEAVRTLSGELEETCTRRSGRTCQVVALYHGGRFMLYEYRRYPDVRLVFAPELQAGFYGGNSDNFTYPRFTFDVSFVRAYGPDDRPVESAHHFGWDPEGPEEGEAVFVTGHPGATSRQITVSQFMYERQIRHPLLLRFLEQRLEVFRDIDDPEVARETADLRFALENGRKLFRGELEGLRSTDLLARKIRWENELRDRIAGDPATASRFGGLWDEIASIQSEKAALFPVLTIADTDNMQASGHLRLAAAVDNYVRQAALPAERRAPVFRGDAGRTLRRRILEGDPIDAARSASLLAGRLAIAEEWLGGDDPLVAIAQPGETAAEAARRLIDGSRIAEPGFRRRALQMTPEELAAKEDPLIDLARRVTRTGERARARWSALKAREEAASERLAGAIFAAFGTDLPPEATFTLRISDGVVEGYPLNGTVAPSKTTLYGLYGRAASFDHEEPWALPARWMRARGDVDMATPLNFVSTNDITGGNSGSPVIDRDARIVGVAFDGNVEAFSEEFLFGAAGGRAVSVHSAGILEALRSVYGARELVRELLE